METAVLVALIASLGSVFVAIGNIYWTAHQTRTERHAAVQAELDLYREPLLSAVDQVGNRLDIIRNEDFFFYLETDRREHALLSTLFRLAQYFAWTEILYGRSGHLHFAADGNTRAVSQTLELITSTFADDRYDRIEPRDFTSSQLAIWREEQRAIGELMIQGSNPPACIGYGSFANNYEDAYSQWFVTFASQMEAMFRTRPTQEVRGSERLDQMQGLMAKLLVELDSTRVLTELDTNGLIVKPRWARPDRYPSVRSVTQLVSNRNSATQPVARS